MGKWQKIEGVEPLSADALVEATLRVLNAAEYTSTALAIIASFIGVEEIPEREDADEAI